MLNMKQLVTIQPNFPHFARFSKDSRLAGIRLNNPHWTAEELKAELELCKKYNSSVPMYFDVKGWQLRVIETHPNDKYLDITLNHPISVKTPTMVIFKAGADSALLERIEEGGRRLIFRGGPRYLVKPGESLQIRDHSLKAHGSQFCDSELEKIKVAREAGITRYFLSYVESQKDVDRFLELVGPDAEVMLKIENLRGLEYVRNSFVKRPNVRLVAARGDLYVEIERPHQIAEALQLIISKDPDACVASRLMLSVINDPVPACADFLELAWLYDIGYRTFMLCDELCLKENLLATAINACESFRWSYQSKVPTQKTTETGSSKAKSFWKKWLG